VTWWRVLVARLLGRGRTPSELDEEMATHLALLEADYQKQGRSPAEARRQLAGATQIREQYQQQRRLPIFDTLARDIGYALRQLRANPGFLMAAVATLALGIGANAAIYQVLDAVVFKSLPVREPARLVDVQVLDNGQPGRWSYPLFREMARRQQVAEGMFAISEMPLREAFLSGGGVLERMHGSLVTGGYFHVLGVQAQAGRLFGDEDDRPAAPPVAVISDAFWDREFARSPQALGQTLHINQASVTIVGVAPAGFFGETVGKAPDAWVPMSLQPQLMPMDWLDAPFSSWLQVIARLRREVTPAQAQQALDALFQQSPELNVRSSGHRYQIALAPAARGFAELRGRFRDPLMVMMAIAGLVLLIACCNLANLLLGRGAARAHEIGVRLALGAGRARLVRQLFTESLVLAGLGSAAGLVLAWRGSLAVVALASASEHWQVGLSLDGRVIGFIGALAVAATCLFGLAPALAATRVDVHTALAGNARTGLMSRPRQRLGKGLVAAQVAITLLLLAGAGMLTGTLWSLRHQDFGFQPEGVVLVELPIEFAPAMMARNKAIREPLYQRVNLLHGVRSAALSGFGPMGSIQHTGGVATRDRPAADSDYARIVHVSPRYFETMGIPMVEGRGIDEIDRVGAPGVVVLSQTAARKLFGGAPTVGRVVSWGKSYNPAQPLEVIGVAHDVHFSDPRDAGGFLVYAPMAQLPAPATEVLMRVQGNPAPVIAEARAAVRAIATNLPVGEVRLLGEVIDSKLANERTLALVSSGFGLLALLLTGVGVYGVISYAVARRTQEIGIRLALGASRAAVSRMLALDVSRMVAIGGIAGAAGGVTAIRALRAMLFGGAGQHYLMIAAALVVLLLVAALAGYLPARRAARLDPMEALRQE
jgi:predicted permease